MKSHDFVAVWLAFLLQNVKLLMNGGALCLKTETRTLIRVRKAASILNKELGVICTERGICWSHHLLRERFKGYLSDVFPVFI